MSSADHIVLFSFLLFSFFFWSKKSYYANRDGLFWIRAILPILLYSFIVGSRYGWGTDYLSYKYKFEHTFEPSDEQIGFVYLNQAISLLGLNYVGAFIIYSLVFISSAFLLIRSYKSESKWMYAFFIPACLLFVSNAIRQGVALSFIFLTIYFFDKRKWFWVVGCLALGSFIHSAVLITAFFIGLIKLSFKKAINWKLSVSLYVFVTFFFNSTQIGFIAPYIQKYFVFGNKFQSYADNSDAWFGAEAADADKYGQGWATLLLSSFFYISIIVLGYFSLKYKPNKRMLYIYNTVVIGIILYRAMFLFEILRRLTEPLVMFNFIILGYIVYVFSTLKRRPILAQIENKADVKVFKLSLSTYNVGLAFILIYLFLFWGRFVFLNKATDFFWNR